jgi:HAD superfamily hydrolase (TIGR01549 family)
MNIQYVFFDVANTLLYKPDLFVNIQSVLEKRGIHVALFDLQRNHKLLSEIIAFPDKTSKEFYKKFNAELLISLGIIPDEKLLDDVFSACTYLAWNVFEDISYLDLVKKPVGIISNWDKSLPEKLTQYIPFKFSSVFASELTALKKPDTAFYRYVLQTLNLKPEEVLFIGDSIKLDMIPAQQAGMKTLLLDRHDFYPHYTAEKIKNLFEIAHFL